MHATIYRSKIKLSSKNKISLSTKLYDSKIGKYNYFGPNVIMNNVIIGNYCSIAPNVIVGGMEHDYKKMSTSTILYKDQIRHTTIIEDDVWIGANAIIKMGVKIGKGAVVGASSVVLKDVPPHSIVVGSPAKVVKKRFDNPELINKHNSIDFSLSPGEINDFLSE
ncbi:CatB-related O-acetyltransferase [Tenacibaculum skagerrakense]|nr:CatB-related O-acetyltransferase [Tenacibaculum skagerrakense]